MTIYQLDLMSVPHIRAMPDREVYVSSLWAWTVRLEAERPRCLTCEQRWESLHARPLPGLFAFIHPWGSPAPMKIAAICRRCCGLSDLPERCHAALRALWPDAEILVAPHAAPNGVQ